MIIFGNSINYKTYDVYKTEENDLSCVSQNTDNLKIITLITCDNFDNSKRMIVKAKENN